jgi:small-conductance mechanosensitive channel
VQIDATTFLDSLPPWQAVVLVVGLSLLGAVVTEFVLLRLARRYVARTDTEFDNILLQELRLPVVVSIALAGLFVLQFWAPAVVAALPFTQEQVSFFFNRPAASIIVLVWAWALNQTVNRLVEAVKDRGSRYDFAPVFSNIWTLVVLVGAVGLVLTIWEIEITPLLGAAGIAGIAVGFAAKDTVANFFGGVALYFDDTYKIGDFIELDSGEKGSVVKVGIRSTTLLTRDEVLITVPNSVLNAAKIINQSAPQRRKRIRVPIGVGYGTDLDEFEELAIALAEAEALVLETPKPRMRFRNFGDSALEYELLCWINSPTREAKAKHNLNRALYAGLNAANIEIPFPKRDVSVAPADAIPFARAEPPERARSAATTGGDGRTATDGANAAGDEGGATGGDAGAATDEATVARGDVPREGSTDGGRARDE